MQSDLYLALKDFELETFEGMRQGFKELGDFIKAVPFLLKDCKNVGADLSNLARIAEILIHPISLIFRVGKNLLLNGVDIKKKFDLGWTAYREGNYFEFG